MKVENLFRNSFDEKRNWSGHLTGWLVFARICELCLGVGEERDLIFLTSSDERERERKNELFFSKIATCSEENEYGKQPKLLLRKKFRFYFCVQFF